MTHIDGLGELGHIEHTPFAQHVYSNLPDAGTHLFYGLPIRWHQATLDKAQLETSRTSDFCRELIEVVKTGTDELQRFHVRDYIRCVIVISINLDKSKCFLPATLSWFLWGAFSSEEREVGQGVGELLSRHRGVGEHACTRVPFTNCTGALFVSLQV